MIEEPTEVGYYAYVRGIIPSPGMLYFDGMNWKQLYSTSYPVYRSWTHLSRNLHVIIKVPSSLWEY